MIEPVVKLAGAGWSVGGKSIVRDLNLTIQPGERVVVIGPNGAGKSTFIKLLSATVLPSMGSVDVLQTSLNARLSHEQTRRFKARVGQVFQGLHLLGRLSVLDNVLIGRLGANRSIKTWARVFSQEDHSIAEKALAAVNLGSQHGERVANLSGGERQKLAVARMLAQRPEIILADEPTASLDPQAARETAELLSHIAIQEKLTLLTVVHSVDLLPKLGERVLAIKDGQLHFDLGMKWVTPEKLNELYSKG